MFETSQLSHLPGTIQESDRSLPTVFGPIAGLLRLLVEFIVDALVVVIPAVSETSSSGVHRRQGIHYYQEQCVADPAPHSGKRY